MDVKTKTKVELATEGYIYCFTNLRSQPGLCKVGMTVRTPTERLSEANGRDTWRSRVCIYGHKQSITPYQIEFAKKVSNPKQKEQTLHDLLTHHTDPLDSIVSGHPGSKLPTKNFYRELFRISPQEVSTFFELCDGELWDENASCPRCRRSPCDENLHPRVVTLPPALEADVEAYNVTWRELNPAPLYRLGPA